jgi:uncharacterized protein (TIGR02217 family)
VSFASFVDAYAPQKIAGFPFGSSPRWSTDITTVKSGASMRNQNWTQPLHRFTAPQAIRAQEDFELVKDMWWVLNGPAKTFPFRDPLDFASGPLPAANFPPVVTPLDQRIGTTDGVTSSYQLTKLYSFGADSILRDITLPVIDSVVVWINGHDPGESADGGPYTWQVSRPGGIVSFDPVPVGGMAVTAGFLFDVQARFEADDTFDGIVQAWKLAGYADLTFVEERAC